MPRRSSLAAGVGIAFGLADDADEFFNLGAKFFGRGAGEVAEVLFAEHGDLGRVVQEEAADGGFADGFGVDFLSVNLGEELLRPILAAGDERLGDVADLVGEVVVEIDDGAADGRVAIRLQSAEGGGFEAVVARVGDDF
jgi:hypothetical protein